MSHRGTNWAILQRGLKPATKLVLWHLCDRHNPDIGCFPSQDQLAYDAEVSRSQLNVHLAELEDLGLIQRLRRVDPQTKRQLRTRYLLAFEKDFGRQPDADPSPETGHGVEAEEGDFSIEPSPETGHGSGKSRVRNPDSNINPVKRKKEEEGVCAQAPARESVAEPSPGPGAEVAPNDDQAFEAFFEELLRAIGHDPNGQLPGWWQGWHARQHVRRWMADFGFGHARIIAIARLTRRAKPEPPDGPKALDAPMARAHRQMLDRAAKATERSSGGPSAKRPKSSGLTVRPSTEELAAFYAKIVNGDGYLPTSSISNSIRDAMLGMGLVTAERLRLRGVR